MAAERQRKGTAYSGNAVADDNEIEWALGSVGHGCEKGRDGAVILPPEVYMV